MILTLLLVQHVAGPVDVDGMDTRVAPAVLRESANAVPVRGAPRLRANPWEIRGEKAKPPGFAPWGLR